MNDDPGPELRRRRNNQRRMNAQGATATASSPQAASCALARDLGPLLCKRELIASSIVGVWCSLVPRQDREPTLPEHSRGGDVPGIRDRLDSEHAHRLESQLQKQPGDFGRIAHAPSIRIELPAQFSNQRLALVPPQVRPADECAANLDGQAEAKPRLPRWSVSEDPVQISVRSVRLSGRPTMCVETRIGEQRSEGVSVRGIELPNQHGLTYKPDRVSQSLSLERRVGRSARSRLAACFGIR